VGEDRPGRSPASAVIRKDLCPDLVEIREVGADANEGMGKRRLRLKHRFDVAELVRGGWEPRIPCEQVPEGLPHVLACFRVVPT